MNNPIRTYQDAWTYLDDLQMHKIKLGLDAMRSILAVVGSPEKTCPAVHVAGTNGKGSVCSMLRSAATAAGYKTGLYTSPHLDSVRERFRIDDGYISEEDFTRLMETIRVGLGTRRITYFECATTLAFLWFAENGCDLVLLETGMGGRLDATNVITPLVSIITTISLDHEQYLGDTIEEVAFEKAGIIKPGVPLISGVGDPAARAVVERTCTERGAPLIEKDRDFTLKADAAGGWVWESAEETVPLSSLPAYQPNGWQLDNISCTVAAASALRKAGFAFSDAAVDRGISGAKWPGRMELIDTGYRYLLDGAHNEAGVNSLIRSLANYRYDKCIVIWASMGDKNYGDILNAMAAVADVMLLTKPDSERAALTGDLYDHLTRAGGKIVNLCETPADARSAAEGLAGPDDLIVVAGSLYLVGEFREALVGRVIDGG